MHLFRRCRKFSLLCIEPCAIHREYGGNRIIVFHYSMTDRPSRIILFCPGHLQVDGNPIAQSHFTPELAFLPEQDRADLQPVHQLHGQGLLVQECHPAKCAPVVVHRMTKMHIGIEVGPANLDFLNKTFHHANLVIRGMKLTGTAFKYGLQKLLLQVQFLYMKKLSFLILMLATAGVLCAQQGTKKPVQKAPQSSQKVLQTLNDSASYAIGYSIASFYKSQGITNLNTSLVSRAINDVLGNKPALCDDHSANSIVTNYLNTIQESKSKTTIEEGRAFLAKNKTRAGVKTTASGLQYEVLTEGTGIKPLATDSVTVNYRGTLLDGYEIDNSYSRGEPITFPLNRVIAGWTEGVQLMSVGSKYKFYIPYNLAYGTHGQGPIPGGATLIFEVELLDVKKAR